MLRNCVLAACVALAACKSSTPAPPAAVPDTCSSDAECKANFRCDLQLRRCVCTSDSACGAGAPFCNAFTGLCVAEVAGCTSNSACGPKQYCDTALRTCKDTTGFCKPCAGDAECGAGSSCLAHPDFPAAGKFCVAACSGGSCAAGLSCRSGSCFPPTACANSNACFSDSLKPCSADTDCDATESCDQSLRACVQRNRTCPAGDACDPQSKLCVHSCSTDQDCVAIENATGYQCRANACFRRNICSQDGDCTNGQICQANPDGSKSCAVGCVNASDCPLGQGCDTTSVPNHPRCASGCTQNADCALNTICSGGTCVSSQGSCAQECQATQVCKIAGNCVNNCCIDANLAVLCPPGGTCGTCPTNGSGCGLSACGSNCFPANVRPGTSQADCNTIGPGYAYNSALQQCQVLVHLNACSQDSDCPYKGFKCVQKSTFACGAGGVCFPQEPAAQAACALGHP